MKKRLYIFHFIILLTSICCAQNISVNNFSLLDSDLTANTAGTMEKDQNGETAALIKVVTTQTGFTFDGGAMGIVKTKQTPGEVWVYIPRGSKKISIKHPQLGVLRDYYFPVAIESARTYEMVLVSGEVQTVVKQARTSQYIVFKLIPQNAVVELDGELLETNNGVASKMKNMGTYNYRVQAPNYLLEAGSVTMDNPKEKKIVEISLVPNFAHITVNVDNNAEIWVNGEKKGEGTWKGEIGAGTYEFEAKKSGYHNTFITHDIKALKEMQFIQLQAPTPICGEINITSTPPIAEVFLDGKLYGETPIVLSDILIGKHELMLKRRDYVDLKSEIYLEEGKVLEINAELKNSVNVTIKCNNPTADLYIDGHWVGNASGEKNIELGKHIIEVKPKSGENFDVYKKEIFINSSKDIINIDLVDKGIYEEIDEMPQYPGGVDALVDFLSTHINYPKKCLKKGITGQVIVSFVVNIDGSITDIQIVQPVDPALDKEAIRVVKMLPRWISGKNHGIPVRVRYTFPITFKLD